VPIQTQVYPQPDLYLQLPIGFQISTPSNHIRFPLFAIPQSFPQPQTNTTTPTDSIMAPSTKKRAAKDTADSQPRKRGRPSNASKKEQKTIEETINNAEEGVEDDQDVADQINGEIFFDLQLFTVSIVA
jgi:hypothetical protein